MSLVRLELGSDLNDDAGRGQLQETLELLANRLRLQTKELQLIKAADRIVQPSPIQAFPVAAGQIYTGEEGGEIGDIMARAVQSAPQGTLECDGAAVSRFGDFSDLFAAVGVTYGIGDGSTTFNLPDLRGRTLVGFGTGTTAPGTRTSWFMGRGSSASALLAGSETEVLTEAQLPAHAHGFNHNHIFQSGSGVGTDPSKHWVAGGPGIGDSANPTIDPTSIDSDIRAAIRGVANPPQAGPLTGDSGTGATHNNLQPSLCLAFYIRYRLGPQDTVQTLPISWGEVNGQWRLDSVQNFPGTDVENSSIAVSVGDLPEAVVKVTAGPGLGLGNTNDLKIIGASRLPYNFTSWKPKAFSIRTHLNVLGLSLADQIVITLRVSDPVAPSSFISKTFTRTEIVSAGTSITDAEFIDAFLTSQDLGPDWKPGYLFRFELEFTHPLIFDTSELSVGLLELNWR